MSWSIPFVFLHVVNAEVSARPSFIHAALKLIQTPLVTQSSFRRPLVYSCSLCIPHSPNFFFSDIALVDKVDTKEVQQQAPKDKIRKRALMRNRLEMLLVLRVCMDA